MRLFARTIRSKIARIDLKGLPLEPCALDVQVAAGPSCCIQGCVRIDLETMRGARWESIAHSAWVLPHFEDGPLRTFPIAVRHRRPHKLRVRIATFEPLPVRVEVFLRRQIELARTEGMAVGHA
jgi:hypothetical protein